MGELLRGGTSVRFRANGRSMYPSIRDGEVVVVEPVEPSDVKRGDIVLYRLDRSTPTQSSVLSPQSSSGVIAHRVVQVNRSNGSHEEALLFRLRGDASSCCDEPVEAQQILGLVVFVERKGRSIHLASSRTKMLHRLRIFASRLKSWILQTVPVLTPVSGAIRKSLTVDPLYSTKEL